MLKEFSSRTYIIEKEKLTLRMYQYSKIVSRHIHVYTSSIVQIETIDVKLLLVNLQSLV